MIFFFFKLIIESNLGRVGSCYELNFVLRKLFFIDVDVFVVYLYWLVDICLLR